MRHMVSESSVHDADDAKSAVTLAFPVIVKDVELPTVVEKFPPLPDHPTKAQPDCGVAVKLMFVPAVKPPLQFCPVLTETVPPLAGLTLAVRE
jgi:hypothetical protein